MSRAMVKPSQNKSITIVEEIFAWLNNHDIEDIMSLFSDEASLIFPGSNSLGGFYLGKKKIKRFFQKLYIMVPDIHFTIKNILHSERTVSVEWISTGITKKGIPYENRGVSFIELKNDFIKEMRLYLDTEKLRNP